MDNECTGSATKRHSYASQYPWLDVSAPISYHWYLVKLSSVLVSLRGLLRFWSRGGNESTSCLIFFVEKACHKLSLLSTVNDSSFRGTFKIWRRNSDYHEQNMCVTDLDTIKVKQGRSHHQIVYVYTNRVENKGKKII